MKAKAPSDSTLQALWRKVVRSEWNNRCVFYGYRECQGSLECHHIKRRRIPHLRNVPSNGVLICQFHHGKMKYRVWRKRLDSVVGEDKMEYLDAMEQMLYPEYLRMHGQTKKQYLEFQKAYLRLQIGGEA